MSTLVKEFKNVGASMITPLHSLEHNRPYPIVFARKTHTQYGLSLQLTLETEKDLFVRVYLLKRYALVFDDDVGNINYQKNFINSFIRERPGQPTYSTWRRVQSSM